MLEDDEMFNSGLLKDYIGQMISAGRRNVAVDLSPLDYIYSDSMNVLMTANKRAREGGGQIVLLKPRPEVTGILQKAGVMGEMRVFAGEGELMAASDEISAASYGAPGGQFGAPQSEFESLRSEIGSAFGDDAMQGAPMAPAPMMAPPPPPPMPMAPPMPPPMPMMAPSMPEMPPPPPMPQPMADIAFQPMAMTPAPMAPPPPPPTAPAFPPPSADAYPQETMEFGSIGSHEPPPRGMTLDDAFAALDDDFSAKKQKQKPIHDDFDDDFGGKKKKKKKNAFDDDIGSDFAFGEKHEPPPKKQKKQKGGFGADDFEFTTKKKGSPVGAILVVLVILVIAGVGGYLVKTGKFDISVFSRGGDDSESAAKPGAPPALPEGALAGGEATDAGTADIPITTIEVETPRPMGTPVPSKPAPVSGKKQKEKAPPPLPPQPRASTPAAAPPPPPPPQYTPTPEPEPTPPAAPPKVEQIVITSTPSGAAVEVDGRRVGTTPHTYKPSSWGDISIAVSMNGYERATKTVEFEGGTVNVPFTLSRAAAAPPPPPPPPPQPTAQQPPAAPSGASGASIFIATLPPKAEVYIGGRLVGTSNEGELQVPVGTHQVRFVKDGVEKTETLTFNPGKNPTKFVNLK